MRTYGLRNDKKSSMDASDQRSAASGVLPQAQIMSLHDKLQLLIKSHELEEQGKPEEAREMRRRVPMPPYLAKFAKEHLGSEFLMQCNWSLSEAEAEYGPGWLTK
jgi:hypothetical protein